MVIGENFVKLTQIDLFHLSALLQELTAIRDDVPKDVRDFLTVDHIDEVSAYVCYKGPDDKLHQWHVVGSTAIYLVYLIDDSRAYWKNLSSPELEKVTHKIDDFLDIDNMPVLLKDIIEKLQEITSKYFS